jgi:hypothetical protein
VCHRLHDYFWTLLRAKARFDDFGSGLTESETEVSVADAKEAYASSQTIANSTATHDEPRGRLEVDCRRGGGVEAKTCNPCTQKKSVCRVFPPPRAQGSRGRTPSSI